MCIEYLLNQLQNEMPKGTLSEESLDLLIDNIGNTDPYIREKNMDMIYLLITNHKLDDNQINKLLFHCLDTLKSDFKSYIEDHVFERSFSTLIIATIVEYYDTNDKLNKNIYSKILNQTIDYMTTEFDVRGYVRSKGWAHSIAHGSDLIVACVKSSKYLNRYNRVILNLISKNLYKLTEDYSCYIDDEDERQIYIIEALLEKGLTDIDLSNWINELLNDFNKSDYDDLIYFRIKKNITDFLKTLYFRLKFNQKCHLTQSEIERMFNELYTKSS